MTDDSIHPFRVAIPGADLDDLHQRLDRTRWPDELSDVGWAYGIPRDYLMELARYWRHEYDWRAAEERLNAWPQFTTTIDSANIHFAHLRSPEPNAIPLIVIHGWPGSIVEFTAIAGPLSDPRAHGADPSDAFHLVLPSIPGFGLSGPTHERGWDHRRVAAAFAELMRRLGYREYGAQGGDWGSVISRELGRTRAGEVLGVHVNLLSSSAAAEEPTEEELANLTPGERDRTLASWRRTREWVGEEDGYGLLQSTRPQTLAYALTDSPVGQLAWIAEKFKAWSDPRSTIDRDQVLTIVMLYWLTGTTGSSARIYYERAHGDSWEMPAEPSPTPMGVAVFPYDTALSLRHVAEHANRIIHWAEYDHGGHFAAMEVPGLLVDDIRTFFRRIRTQQPVSTTNVSLVE